LKGRRGRLGFGVGDQALNEHTLGGPWASAPLLLEMLQEAIGRNADSAIPLGERRGQVVVGGR